MALNTFRNDEINSLLLDCLSEGSDFQSIISRIADRFNVEIAIVTIDGRPLFRSGEFVLSDSRRYIRLSEDRNVYLSPVDGGGCRVGATIFSDELPFGAVLVSCHKDSELATVSEIAESLAKLYQYVFGLREKPQIFPFVNQILAHFLLSDTFMPNAAYTVLDELTDWSESKSRFRPGYAVAAFANTSSDKDDVPGGAIAQFTKFIPNSYCIKRGDKILSFIYGLDTDSVKKSKVLCTAIDSFCKTFSMRCAVSDIFEDLAERKAAVQHSSVLISRRNYFGQSENIIMAEEHYKELILFGALETSDPRIFRMSGIERLADYDKEHGTEYLETLESYLLSAGQFTRAAKMLFVDRGTLKYRMNKIREIISCDPDDPIASEYLLLAIDMRKIILQS